MGKDGHQVGNLNAGSDSDEEACQNIDHIVRQI